MGNALDQDTQRLFSCLWRGGDWANYWTKTGDRERTVWFPAERPGEIPQGDAVYFGVHPCRERKNEHGRTSNDIVAAINCLYADFDSKDFEGNKGLALAHILKLSSSPTVIVDSGGGYHAYWIFESPFTISDDNDRQRAARLQACWVGHVGGDPGAKDLARMLRLPGTLNRKYEPPRLVTIYQARWDVFYSFDDLEALFPAPAPGVEGQGFVVHYENRNPQKWLADALDRARDGLRNATGLWLACQLRDDGYHFSDAQTVMGEYARKVPAGEETYTEREALASLKQAFKKDPRGPARGNGRVSSNMTEEVLSPDWEPAELPPIPEPPADAILEDAPPGYLLNESHDHEGHARCVLQLYPGRFAYCDAYGWLAYNGRFWQRENAESFVDRAIVATLKARRVQAVKAENEPLVKVTKATSGNVAGTKSLLQSLVIVSVDDFDKHPDLLNCNNGVVNLRTGELTPHRAEQRFTYAIPADYDLTTDYSLWLSFLGAAIGNDQSLLEYIQVATGYSLTGHTWEEVMIYLYGPTRSGKGTFTETMLAMLGQPLATEADFQTFTADRYGDTQNFDLAPLKPCRFVAASESNKNSPLNPAKIKALTGGNYVRCAFKHRDHFTYRPQFKIWLSSNHPVNVDVDDDAAWGRVRVVEFPHSHLGKEDKTLKARLTQPENLRGVLRWAVEGAMKWYRLPKGLNTPQAVQKATQAQRNTQDFIQQYLDECCEKDATAWIHSGALWENYRTWCEANGVPPKYQNAFSQAIVSKGFSLTRIREASDGKVKRVITGLKFATRDAL